MTAQGWLHSLFPSKCLEAISDPYTIYYWHNDALVCPCCGRLIAYRYPLHHEWNVVVCSAYAKYQNEIIASGSIGKPRELKIDLSDVYEAIHRRDTKYDSIICESDNWDENDNIAIAKKADVRQTKEQKSSSVNNACDTVRTMPSNSTVRDRRVNLSNPYLVKEQMECQQAKEEFEQLISNNYVFEMDGG